MPTQTLPLSAVASQIVEQVTPVKTSKESSAYVQDPNAKQAATVRNKVKLVFEVHVSMPAQEFTVVANQDVIQVKPVRIKVEAVATVLGLENVKLLATANREKTVAMVSVHE